ncbi:MAG: hypothetical protein LBB13_01500 [Rickettsiales bacterium]|jgi:undecaprenyl-diphosphatase|nr:hypothetical protein [Rickettsiales bacterium]
MIKAIKIAFLCTFLTAFELEAKIIEVDRADQVRTEFEKIGENTLLIFNYSRAGGELCEYAFRNYRKKFLLEMAIRDYLLLTLGHSKGERIETIKNRAYIFCHKTLESVSESEMPSFDWANTIDSLQSRGVKVILSEFHGINVRGTKTLSSDVDLQSLFDGVFRQNSRYKFKRVVFVDDRPENMEFAKNTVEKLGLEFFGLIPAENMTKGSPILDRKTTEKRHWLFKNRYLSIGSYFLARFFLLFGHMELIIPIVIAGILLHRREYYGIATCFICFAIVFNSFLKNFFRIPLYPHLGLGYAFPSGHMHASAMFYGYILYAIDDRRMKIALATIIGGLGFALIRCNFHNLFDVFGATVFTLAEIKIYHYLANKFGKKFMGIFAVFFLTMILLILGHFYIIRSYVWSAFCILIGFVGYMEISGEIDSDNLVRR